MFCTLIDLVDSWICYNCHQTIYFKWMQIFVLKLHLIKMDFLKITKAHWRALFSVVWWWIHHRRRHHLTTFHNIMMSAKAVITPTKLKKQIMFYFHTKTTLNKWNINFEKQNFLKFWICLVSGEGRRVSGKLCLSRANLQNMLLLGGSLGEEERQERVVVRPPTPGRWEKIHYQEV